MYLFIAGFFSNVWIDYGTLLISCFLWGAVGLAIISPVLLADSVYQGHKASGIYRFGQAYHLKREGHYRDAKLFGGLLALEILFIAVITSL